MAHPTTPPPIPGAPPPATFRGVLLAIALVAGFAELAYAVMNVSAMPVYLHHSMGYGAASVVAIGAAFLLCEGLMKGPFGVLGDRIGRKRLIIAGPLVSVATSLLTLAVQPHQWYLFVILRALDGLGAAALWPSALAMIADVVEDDRRSQAMSLFNVTYLVGIALGPFIGGAANDLTALVTEQLGMRNVDPLQASFYLISALFFCTAVAAWRQIPHIPPHHERHPEVEGGFSLSALLRSLRQMPEMLLMAFVTFLGIGMIMLIIKLFALAEFRLSETAFGALLLVPCLIIALASVPLGTVGDRIGKARAVRLGIGLCAAAMWALILIKSEIALVLGGSIIGVGFVIAFPAWMAYISARCHPRQRGAVMGAVGTAQGLGAMIGVPLGGWLYEHAHIRTPFLPWINSHYAPFIGCAILLLAAWILAVTTIKDTPAQC